MRQAHARGVRGLVVAATAVMMLGLAAPAQAHTPAMDRLEKAGWSCLDLGPLGWHCFNRKSATVFTGAEPVAVTVKVFQVHDDHEEFAGTELLLHEDVFERSPNPQPCPQDGGHWHSLAAEGLPYYACHHYDTGGH